MSRYRQGSKVALNVYDGDTPIFQAHTPEEAERLTELLNLGQRSKEFLDAWHMPVADFLTPPEFPTPPETPLSSPVPEIEPVGAQDPPKTPEGKLVDLMGELERSVNEAKASRKRKRAELKAAYDGLCVAEGCTTPHLTAWDDGEGPLLLCERHGDELAVGFPLKPGAREVSA